MSNIKGELPMNDIDQTKSNWDDLAEINAIWFNTPNERIAKNIDLFFQNGKSQLKKELDLITSLQISLNKGTALDFGCGIGRITQALAEVFEVSYGIDISEKMIEIAKKHNRFGDKCKYIANIRDDLMIFKDGSFDFVFSDNVLQHNSPDVIKKYIEEFARILRPDGILFFQIPLQLPKHVGSVYLKTLPKFHPKRIWNKLRGILIGHDISTRYYRLRKLGLSKKWLNDTLGLHPHINMYSMEENTVREILGNLGCIVKHVEKYDYEKQIHAVFIVVKNV